MPPRPCVNASVGCRKLLGCEPRTRPTLQFPILRRTMPLDEFAEAVISAPEPPATPITDAERYSRQVLFVGIGATGQQRLATAHVAIVGCGAMGAASASLLARAGVGTLTLIDRDYVEP